MPGKPRTKGEEESGTSLSHHSFVPMPGKHYSLRPMALPPSRLMVTESAANRVGLAPIAIDRDDLEFSASHRNHRPFLDTAPNDAGLEQRIKHEVEALLDMTCHFPSRPRPGGP
ncbi:hypothetical protein ACCS93_38465 [Rhizobium ruizarguesonis]